MYQPAIVDLQPREPAPLKGRFQPHSMQRRPAPPPSHGPSPPSCSYMCCCACWGCMAAAFATGCAHPQLHPKVPAPPTLLEPTTCGCWLTEQTRHTLSTSPTAGRVNPAAASAAARAPCYRELNSWKPHQQLPGPALASLRFSWDVQGAAPHAAYLPHLPHTATQRTRCTRGVHPTTVRRNLPSHLPA
jgi:hypothetical protein